MSNAKILFKFTDLSETAQQRAIREYQTHWRMTHTRTSDLMNEYDTAMVLLDHNEEWLYSQLGYYRREVLQ